MSNWLQIAVVRVARLHFFYVAAYMVAIIAFDSWNLITHEGIVQRWTLAVCLLILTTIVWYIARGPWLKGAQHRILLGMVVVGDILFAAINVYMQRGMASKSVALFAIPLMTAAVLHSRRAILATASLCVAAYSFAAIRYFHLHYGEGFKVELYGEVGFYSAIFFVMAALLVLLVAPKKD